MWYLDRFERLWLRSEQDSRAWLSCVCELPVLYNTM